MLTVQKPATQSITYVNALGDAADDTAIALLLLLQDSQGNEKLCDVLLPNDRFHTVIRFIRSNFPGWSFVESFDTDERGSGRLLPF